MLIHQDAQKSHRDGNGPFVKGLQHIIQTSKTTQTWSRRYMVVTIGLEDCLPKKNDSISGHVSYDEDIAKGYYRN